MSKSTLTPIKRASLAVRRHRDIVGAESGAVMVLVSMLLIVFVIMMSLALDTASLAASAEQARFAAKYAALEALETYVATIPNTTGTPQERQQQALDAALAAANQAGSLNLVLAKTKDATAFDEAVTETPDDIQTRPVLVAGRFYSAESPIFTQTSVNCTQSVCGPGKSPPCFVPLKEVNHACDPSASGDPNAFQIVGPYYSGIRKWLASAFSPGTLSIHVDEVAAVVPRHTCFLVDISKSMVQETHDEFAIDAAGNKDNEAISLLAYYLKLDNGMAASVADGDDNDNDLWEILEASRSADLNAPDSNLRAFKRKHYKDDYSLIEVMSDVDYGSTVPGMHPDPTVINPKTGINYSVKTTRKKYRVDTRFFEDPSSFVGTSYESGPEPFTTVFKTLNALVGKFKERAVVGDQICLMFFDNSLEWPRIVNLTADFDAVKKYTDLSLQGENEGWRLIFKHGIFPVRTRDSNLTMAVAESFNQFSAAQQSSIPSMDQIVVFGDGLTNCNSCKKPCGNPLAPPGCMDDYRSYNQSVKEFHKFAYDQLYPRRIRLDFVLMGSHVQPNSLLIGKLGSDGNYKCMTDSEARIDKLDFTDNGPDYADIASISTAYDNQSDLTPFLRPNSDMYGVVRLLGGSWVPIKEFDPTAECNPTCGPNTVTQTKSCSTPAQQALDAVDEIMGSNPYMIVKH